VPKQETKQILNSHPKLGNDVMDWGSYWAKNRFA